MNNYSHKNITIPTNTKLNVLLVGTNNFNLNKILADSPLEIMHHVVIMAGQQVIMRNKKTEKASVYSYTIITP